MMHSNVCLFISIGISTLASGFDVIPYLDTTSSPETFTISFLGALDLQ